MSLDGNQRLVLMLAMVVVIALELENPINEEAVERKRR